MLFPVSNALLRKVNWGVIGVIITITLLIGCKTKDVEAPLIPLESFFRNPEKTNIQLSPDGFKVSFLEPWNNRLNVFVQNLENDTTFRITSSSERDISYYFWANDYRIVYLQDTYGDENYRLYAVNIDGTEFKDLTPFQDTRAYVVDELKNIPDEMIIAMNRRDKKVFDVYRINILSGSVNLLVENPGNITGWLTDHEGNLRAARTTDGVNSGILYRENERDEFQIVQVTNFKEFLYPIAFTFDNRYVYAISNVGRDKSAIIKYDIANGIELETIYEHYDVDVEHLYLSMKRKIITGVSFTTWKREYHFFDDQEKKLYHYLTKKLACYEISITSKNKNEDKVLVRTYSDKSMGTYYFYDINNNNFRKLSDVSPWLNEEDMADMKSISYKARDGFTIHGYLTIPRGVEPENLPVIVSPHGGPWTRDRWGFNKTDQFFANRGYAVLRMNYRGSEGYGRDFLEAGFKQWGKSMQDDITDGVEWLIEQNIADADRIGIYGASFGGYCALSGLTFTPDLYKCGVDYVGISNIFAFLESIPPYWESFREMLYEMVGNPQTDSLLLYESSPIFHLNNIKVPVLIAQGKNDPKVKLEDTENLVKVLRKNGIEVTYIAKENEGHGFRNEENRIELYKAMEKFFAKHLKGRKERIN